MNYLGLAFVGAVLVLLEVSISGLLSIGSLHIKPSLTVPFVVYIGLQLGPIAGTLTGAAVGFALDMIGGSPLGSTVFSYCVIGFFCGKTWDRGPFRIIWPWAIYLLAAALFAESIAGYLFSRAGEIEFFPLFLRTGLPAAAYTMLVGLLWFLSPLHRTR